MPYTTSTNMFNYSRYIVEAGSPYTKIQDAINAANTAGGGTVLIRPGIYTENLTLYDNVNLEAATGTAISSGVFIDGIHVPPSSGIISFKNIYFFSATHIFSSAVAGTTFIDIDSCDVTCTNGYVFNLPNWKGRISTNNLLSNSTADGFINSTDATNLIYITNSSVGDGANAMIIAGPAEFYNTNINCPQTFQTSANVVLKNCTVTKTQTYTNNATGRLTDTALLTGATPAISTTSANPIYLENTTINSSNVPVIAGTGTIVFGSVTYMTNSGIAGTITKTYGTKFESGILKLDDADTGPLIATTGLISSPVMTNGQLIIGSTGVAPAIAGLTPGAGIAITNGAGSITISAWGGGISWTQKGASTPLVKNNGFIVNAGGALSFSLPAISSIGDVVALVLDGATSWTITQAAGQQIRFGNIETTLGAGGSLTSTDQGDAVWMLCVAASTRWVVLNSVGNITHV